MKPMLTILLKGIKIMSYFINNECHYIDIKLNIICAL